MDRRSALLFAFQALGNIRLRLPFGVLDLIACAARFVVVDPVTADAHFTAFFTCLDALVLSWPLDVDAALASCAQQRSVFIDKAMDAQIRLQIIEISAGALKAGNDDADARQQKLQLRHCVHTDHFVSFLSLLPSLF